MCCLCSKDLHERKEQYPREAQNGQHNCDCVHQSHGRYTVPKLSTMCSALVAMVSTKEDHHLSRAPTWSEQGHHRSGVLNTSFFNRMETASSNLPSNKTVTPAISICYTPQQSVPTLCQLAARFSDIRIPNILVEYEGIRISPVFSGGKMLTKALTGKNLNPASGSHSNLASNNA